MEGSLALPGEPAYEWARRRFVAGDRDVLPLAMACCATAADVATAIAFARRRGLPFALRSGGHSYADHSSTGGLLIDVAGLDQVAVADDGGAVVGAGVTVGALAGRLAARGRQLPCGSCPTVGVAGITLAGGFGLLGRVYGLTADHVVAVEAVLADGRVTTVDAEHDPDLLWALLGAGAGSFAAVTSFTFRTRPAVPTTRLYAVWPFRHAVTVVDRWQRWAPDLDGRVTAELMLVATDRLAEAPAVELFGAAVTTPEETARLLDGLVTAVGAAPERLEVHQLAPGDAARFLAGSLARDNEDLWLPDGPYERPGFRFTRSEFLDRPLPPDAVAALVGNLVADRALVEHRELELIPWGGAYGLVPPDATAFPHRRARLMIRHTVIAGASATPDRRHAARRWVTSSWATVHPHGSGHVYPGYPDPDLAGWEPAYYGPNLPRLTRVKAAYDPEGVFTFAQSVPPATNLRS